MITLYEFPPSRSIRVRWTLQELGIPFDSVTVRIPQNEHKLPQFLRVNPAGKLPALVDDDYVITESVAIVRYLAEKHPEKNLLPSSLRERTDVERWMLFAVTELEQPLWRIARHSFIYPEAQRLPAEITIASQEFCEMARVLELHMSEREFVASTHVSIADFVTAYTLDWANEEELLKETPHLRRYMERMYARPKAALRIKDALASVGLE